VLIEIETKDRQLALDILGDSNCFNRGKIIDIPGNARLILKRIGERKGSGFSATIVCVIAFGSGVASRPIAHWLYQKIAGRASRIRIDRTETAVSKEEIKRIIREKVRRVCP
jgi:hypothetical protein